MVKFVPVDDDGEHLAPVSYLPGIQVPARDGITGPRARRVRAAEVDEAGEDSGADVRELGRGRGGAQNGEAGSRASHVAVHQLARRGMSRWELEQVLRKRGVDDDQAAAELDRLESVGLLDDAALALTLVFTLHTRRGLGRRAIAHELAGRHIDPDIVMDALSEIEDDDERERALELAVKRLGQLSAYDDETIERRLSGFLARKGYGSGLVRDVVSAAMGARESPVRFS